MWRQVIMYRHSLVYEIQRDDVYEDFYKEKNLFDFSNYPKNFIGKMKEEVKENIIYEFVGLKPKMYSSSVTINNKKLKKQKTSIKIMLLK